MDDDDYTVPCPRCGVDIFDDAEQCPHCREYLSSADFRKPVPKWVLVIIVLTIAALLLPTLGAIIRSILNR